MNIFKRKKSKDLDMSKLPKHIAFIMDGNGRYATKRGMPRTFGHKMGLEALKRIIQASYELGIKVVSFFMFSTENWKRPKEEIDYIFSLAKEFNSDMLDEYVKKGIKIVSMGDMSKLPIDLQDSLKNAIDKTANCDKMIVNLGVNYGGRSEIVRACNQILNAGLKEVDEETFSSYLYTCNLPDPDLIVRSSGEMRVSNFMLFQLAYSEMIFPMQYWPEFNKDVLCEIIKDFQKRSRRFGGLK